MLGPYVPLLFYFIICISCSLASDDFVIKETVIKPGGVARSVSIEGFGVECKFDYTCQGGTGEEWHFSMVYSKQLNRLTCHIQRPSDSSSYLFFQKFALTIIGPATVISGNAYADKSTQLAPDEYNLDLKNNMIAQNNENFKGHLVHVVMEFELDSSRPDL
ncbi:Myeloid-derived growth factor [Taenia solium]|eukprot:TsM_000444200 transcript=TsM_000444200 gene=TsM_000444200